MTARRGAPPSADELYERASAIDDDPDRAVEAEGLYRQAIAIDAQHSLSMTNLGNLHYRRGDVRGAIALYQQAIDANREQPEAWYNLGYIALADGAEYATAIRAFRIAIDLDPAFADALFNLALAYSKRGATAFARLYFRRYLAAITPGGGTSQWDATAREYIERHGP